MSLAYFYVSVLRNNQCTPDIESLKFRHENGSYNLTIVHDALHLLVFKATSETFLQDLTQFVQQRVLDRDYSQNFL